MPERTMVFGGAIVIGYPSINEREDTGLIGLIASGCYTRMCILVKGLDIMVILPWICRKTGNQGIFLTSSTMQAKKAYDLDQQVIKTRVVSLNERYEYTQVSNIKIITAKAEFCGSRTSNKQKQSRNSALAVLIMKIGSHASPYLSDSWRKKTGPKVTLIDRTNESL